MKKNIVKGICFFPLMYAFMEIMLHLAHFGVFDTGVLYAVLFGSSYGLLSFALSSLGSKTANRIIAWCIASLTAVYFSLQVVYLHIFKVYISIYTISQNAGDATEFWKEALHGVIACIPLLMLVLVLPLAAVGYGIKNGFVAMDLKSVFSQEKKIKGYIIPIASFAASVFVYLLTVLILPAAGRGANSSYDLYHDHFVLDLGIQKLGVITSAGLDVKEVLFRSESSAETSDDYSGLASLSLPVSEKDTSSEASFSDPAEKIEPSPLLSPEPTLEPSVSPTPAPTCTPTPTPIDTSPNVLNIDFKSLAENEKKSEIKKLHEYFADSAPTNKNKYTGMFKGYNFIYLTCEGFNPFAVDKDITPTLYMLTHSGFIFNNFYNPLWYTSTSDGEYVACQGLLPYNTNSFKRSKNNALPFTFGWQFLKLGYNSRAYHAHTATYYGRNETHPNMGYIFKAKKAGLDITDVWPESDLEMMELSIPEYIGDEHFHTYYMTVSGHLEYSFAGNTQAKKNKDLVNDLPYSDEYKAYLAANIELDKAMAYLIDELDKAGKLDNTVIAFGGDHYPYGLSDAAIDEAAGHHVERNFELYENYFVIWNSQITEPIIIDKYCSSLDMMPTLSNLFGLEYDSRLFMGSDILSDSPALVIFSNQSFITDYCMYNSKTGDITMLKDVELPDDYIQNVSRVVQTKFNVSKNILLNDYYRYIMDYIPNVVTKVPDSYK